jgi:hypothetical protein
MACGPSAIGTQTDSGTETDGDTGETAVEIRGPDGPFDAPYLVFLNGGGSTTTDEPTVFSSWGSAWVPLDSVSPSGFTLHLDAEQVFVDVAGTVLEDRLHNILAVEPVALVEPAAIVIAVMLYESWTGLLLVDTDGHVILSKSMFRGTGYVPAIGDGFIASIEPDTQRLVAIEAPVERVADGPWPIAGGDPQGTRSAEGM